tara:strand:+ start:111 stop:374 length:264 start_codon:yes stop_codon:yes gene_type:complete
MKIDSINIAIITILLIGFLYLYNNPIIVYKNEPVYYPVYENRYIPINREYIHNNHRHNNHRHNNHRHRNHKNDIHQINENTMGNALE